MRKRAAGKVPVGGRERAVDGAALMRGEARRGQGPGEKGGDGREYSVMAEMIVQQWRLFMISALYGAALGVWYDFFRAVRRKISHKDRTVHLEDVIFSLTAAAGLFLLFQICSRGEIRFYVLAGLFAGALLYFFLLSPLVEKGMEFLVGAAVFLLLAASRTLVFPIKFIVKSLLKTLKKLRRTVKIVRNRK